MTARLEVRSRFSGEVVGSAPATPADVEAVTERAHAAAAAMLVLPAHENAAILARAAELVPYSVDVRIYARAADRISERLHAAPEEAHAAT